MAEVRFAFGAGNGRATHPQAYIAGATDVSFAIGAQKLGQPVPESNFVSELKSALLQHMQR